MLFEIRDSLSERAGTDCSYLVSLPKDIHSLLVGEDCIADFFTRKEQYFEERTQVYPAFKNGVKAWLINHVYYP